jgi:hypothetical protein
MFTVSYWKDALYQHSQSSMAKDEKILTFSWESAEFESLSGHELL